MTEPPRLRPAAAAAAAAGRLPARVSTLPGRARPAPAPSAPGCAAECLRPASAPRSGSAPTRPAAWAQSRLSSRATQGAPRPVGIPAAGAGGGVWVSPESTRGVWENGGGGEPGKTQERVEDGGYRNTGLCVGGPGEEGTRELGWILPNR